MTIWGHENVKVEKDFEKRCWHVRTMQGTHLCTIPWSDAFRDVGHATDYAAAIATCMGHPRMALTPEEERIAYGMLNAANATKPASPATPPTNVVSVDFKTKRRL